MATRLQDAPAWGRDGLFPTDTGFDLDDLAPDYDRYRGAIADVQREIAALKGREKAETEERQAALLSAARRGQTAKVPERTSPEQVERELADARERLEAAQTAYQEFCDDAAALIEAKAAVWQSDLDQRRGAAEETRAEARRMLAEADAQAVEIERLSRWIGRMAGDPVGHVPWVDWPAPTPVPVPEFDSTHGGIIHAA